MLSMPDLRNLLHISIHVTHHSKLRVLCTGLGRGGVSSIAYLPLYSCTVCVKKKLPFHRNYAPLKRCRVKKNRLYDGERTLDWCISGYRLNACVSGHDQSKRTRERARLHRCTCVRTVRKSRSLL